MNNKIVMLSRELLHPHPDNPRKDLGDLKELADSIREHGIMQNLTVVPDTEDGPTNGTGYIILIGHRRFAASEGILDTLPCAVVKVDKKEQMGIMLCENMQRSDLTYQEQAHGFQMMMDLGDTIETIAEKTGFSKQTIKHRLAIAELDPDAVKEATEYFQLSIRDYMELEKVDDLEERNEILKMVTCSKELKDEVQEYIEEKKRDKNFEYYRKIFLEAGWEEQKADQWFYYRDEYKRTDTKLDSIDLTWEPLPEKEIKAIIGKIKGVIHFGHSYRSIQVRKYNPTKAKKEEEKKSAEKEKEAKLKKNRKALREIQAEICDSYMDYFNTTHHDNQIELSTLYLFIDLARDLSCTLYFLNDKVKYRASIVSNKGYESPENNPMFDFDCWTPLFQLLGNIYWSLASEYQSLSDYYGRPKKEILEAHKSFQTLMKEYLDYHPRKEWEDVLNGTSDLFTKEADDEDSES